ncbi:Crp/Fnr family transcriptional regulator [Pseudoroseicyclus sp. CXY001]|uniref:Crp/Fnr family transcriptional regulator n=1 Tax=Pseudoroseicyclus sp. CXY001 TaxID=3242492 RepID=UPI00358DB60E
MTTPCSACPLRRREHFVEMTRDEVRQTEAFKAGEMTIEPGTHLLIEGAGSAQLYTALSGMGLRYKSLADGSRQVLNIIFPGDFVGLQAGVMGEMKHSVVARTQMTLCVFDRNEFYSFVRSSPNRGFDVTWLAAMEEHFLGEALATVGQRDASDRIAWALVRIYQRGQALGMVNGGGLMPFPFRQQDLADLLGLSLVHTNKTLARLRRHNLVRWQDGQLAIPGLEPMAEMAGLELEPPPRRPLI